MLNAPGEEEAGISWGDVTSQLPPNLKQMLLFFKERDSEQCEEPDGEVMQEPEERKLIGCSVLRPGGNVVDWSSAAWISETSGL